MRPLSSSSVTGHRIDPVIITYIMYILNNIQWSQSRLHNPQHVFCFNIYIYCFSFFNGAHIYHILGIVSSTLKPL